MTAIRRDRIADSFDPPTGVRITLHPEAAEGPCIGKVEYKLENAWLLSLGVVCPTAGEALEECRNHVAAIDWGRFFDQKKGLHP